LLNQYYSCRLKREEIIGDYLRYEEAVENMEGPAFYCEHQFYNQFDLLDKVLKDNYNQRHFFGVLTTPFYGRKSLRHRHLAAGMAMCYILSNHFEGWQSEYYTGSLSLYDYFISKFKPINQELDIDAMYYGISKFHTQNEVLGHQVSFNEFNNQQGVKITLEFKKTPQFKGFDPMSAESINDSTILHKTFLRLFGGEQNKLFIVNQNAVAIIGKEVWFIQKVILFAPEKSILVENNRIIVDVDGKNVSWLGKLKIKTENAIVFECE
ncbi:MAG: hypothetical protein PHE03_03560, partial [Bacteroidales bacterium]|nr:hypothetical protein [Bacteroidales bacterium]